MRLVETTIPGHIHTVPDDVREDLLKLFRLFGSTRRRMYNMKWKHGLGRDHCIHNLSDVPLNSRYMRDAWYTIEDLPPHVTFGGLENQRLREKGKITKERWEERRNSIVLSRGDKSKRGNLNMRIVKSDGELKLRVNIPFRKDKYVHLGLFIPEKYMEKYGQLLLCGTWPYTVTLKRENGKIYAKISLRVPYEEKESTRVMAVDTNSGHLDFAVMDKKTEKVVAVGKVQDYDKNVYKSAKKVARIANHYDADVVIGNLHLRSFNGGRKQNRKVHSIPYYKLQMALKRYTAEHGRRLLLRSEAYTSIISRRLSPLIGLDVHKASAITFALKSVDYERFLYLRGVTTDEGNGSLSGRLNAGCGITSPRQGNLACDDVLLDGGYVQTPGMDGLDAFASNIKQGFAYHGVKIC